MDRTPSPTFLLELIFIFGLIFGAAAAGDSPLYLGIRSTLKIYISTTATATALNAESRASCVVSAAFWPMIAFHLIACNSSALRPILPAFIYVKIYGFLAFP
ncbi:hypothetical protein B0H13DRAFT_2046013, partial [Mycena leptocephala]